MAAAATDGDAPISATEARGQRVAAVSAAWSWWPAPAKLNLFLHVIGRCPDGYHELQTLFQLIDLCDSIGVTPQQDGRIERVAGPAGVAPEDDLVVRAARAL